MLTDVSVVLGKRGRAFQQVVIGVSLMDFLPFFIFPTCSLPLFEIKPTQHLFVWPFLHASKSQIASDSPIELPLNQPKPSRKQGKTPRKTHCRRNNLKKPWEEQSSEGSPPLETVGEREEQNTGLT